MNKVKIGIPLESLIEVIETADVDFDEAINLIIKGSVNLIKDNLKNEYENYLKDKHIINVIDNLIEERSEND